MAMSEMLVRMGTAGHLLASRVLLDRIATSGATSHIIAPSCFLSSSLLVLLNSLPPSLFSFKASARRRLKGMCNHACS